MATNTPPNTATPPGANTQTPRLTPDEFLVEWQLQAQHQEQTDPAIVEAHEGYVKYHTGQAQAQQQANAPRFTPIEAVEALAPRPPKDYLLDSIYIAGKLYIVAGDAGTGKSFYSLGLAMHIANGEPFLGHPTKQCPVLYIDEENGKDEYLERVKWIAKGAGFDLDTTPLIGFTDDGLNIANQDDLDELEQGLRSDNALGVKRVYRKKGKKSRPFAAAITVDRKQRHLGYFETVEAAAAAYREAAIRDFGEYARFT